MAEDENNAIKREEMPEDEEQIMLNDVQEAINKYNKIVDEKLKLKEDELMKI